MGCAMRPGLLDPIPPEPFEPAHYDSLADLLADDVDLA